MTRAKKSLDLRPAVQIVFLLLVIGLTLNRALATDAGPPLPLASNVSLHAVCPFGGVVSIYQFATTGTYVRKVHEASWILMLIGFLLAILFGPVFCGWICPMGTVQEGVGAIGKRIIGRRRFNAFVPARWDRWLRYLRYLVLAWVIYMTAATGTLVFENVDPYFALFNLWSSELAVGGVIVLGAVLLASLFIERPFCKYACPYGALLGLFNFVRVFRIRRSPSTCIDCSACDRACPMNIVVSSKKTVFDHQCITCMKCTSEAACPVANTVILSSTAKF